MSYCPPEFRGTVKVTNTPTQPPDVGGVKERLRYYTRQALKPPEYDPELLRDALAVIEALEEKAAHLEIDLHCERRAPVLSAEDASMLGRAASVCESHAHALLGISRVISSDDCIEIAARIRALLSKEGI